MRKITVYSYVGYAIKSGNVLIGVENIIKGKQPFVILYDKDIGKSALDKLLIYSRKKYIKNFSVNIEEFFPNRNCKALGITEKNLAAAIINELEEG